jgi:glycosyltransferase involved in cell wall biosynthesis
VSENIIFCGVRNDVENIIAISEFTVLPSLTEGLPLALLESMALGRPAITCNVGGIPEVITDGENGFLIPPRDEYALADRIITLLSNAEILRKMEQVATERAQNFNIDAGVKNTIIVYKEMIQSH